MNIFFLFINFEFSINFLFIMDKYNFISIYINFIYFFFFNFYSNIKTHSI